MNDLAYKISSLIQHARGLITYGVPVAAVKASGTVTIVSYALLNSAAATENITVTDYTQLSGKTVTVAGHVLTEGADFTAATSNDVTATSLALAITGLTEVNASAVGAVITVVAATAGAAGNSITTVTNATAGITVPSATLLGGRDATTINVDGNALVAGVGFTAATSNSDTATSLATAIDGLSGVGAGAVGAVVTITNDAYGTAGNSKILTTSNVAGATVSGATLAGGVVGDTIIVNSNTFTCVISSPAANQFSSIAELEVLVEAVTDINSSVVGATILVEAAAPGVAGNAITLAVGVANAGTMAVSGATLTGGVDATYTDAIEFLNSENPTQVDAVIDIDAISGGAGVVVTPQTSFDKENWIDRTPTSSLTATGVTELHTTEPLTYFRYKVVFTGTNPTVSLKINANPSR
jgi:hypothetical protein